MTTDSSSLMEHLLLERDTPVPTVEVEALGVTVVEDGDQMDAQHLRSVPHACYCTDGRHRDERDREAVDPNGWLREGAHPITVHSYVVISETRMSTQPRTQTTATSATASAVETVSEAIVTGRFTTCGCPNVDGPHDDQDALKRSHERETDAEIIARHTGRHVVPVSEIRTEVSA